LAFNPTLPTHPTPRTGKQAPCRYLHKDEVVPEMKERLYMVLQFLRKP